MIFINKKEQNLGDINKKKKIINHFRLKKQNFKNVIPLNIYQTWHSDDLPESVSFCVNKIKKTNPEFNHYMFNEEKCRNFIKENFSQNVLDGYDSLIPYALKADLWRYCVLYKNGGLYLDVKYYCINNFKLILLTDKEYFCRDIKESKSGIYNAIIACKPNNNIMMNCINQVLQNIKLKFYGNSSLEPTGPLMVKKFFSQQEFNNLNLELCVKNNTIFITYNTLPILYFHKKYRNDQQKHVGKHWAEYWDEKNIYK
jgi:mannosyltransferase OCH1-like enzyme